MPKLKTRKMVAKRYRKTATGKLMKRTAGQDHFNARESGKVTRHKRQDGSAHDTIHAIINSMMPF